METKVHRIKSDIHSVLRFITPYLPDNPVIIEAGAFHGYGTVIMAQNWPQAVIHAFEPVPDIFAKLEAKTRTRAQVQCYQLALSDTMGSAVFHLAEKPEKPGIPTQAGSLLRPKERLSWSPMVYQQDIEVKTITLDEWANQHNKEHIDFLWLDLQGHELAALKGAIHLLQTVTVVYTEVHFIEAYDQQPLFEEVSEWLQNQGFSLVAQDFTDQISWFFGNAVFIRQNKNQF